MLYTDGGDTRSAINQGELLELLKASDVTVYSIGYLQHQGSGRQDQQQILTRFAAATGGQAFFPSSLKDLDGMYDRILRDIAARYSLGYVSSNADPGRCLARGEDPPGRQARVPPREDPHPPRLLRRHEAIGAGKLRIQNSEPGTRNLT